MPIEFTNNKRMHEKEMLVLDYTQTLMRTWLLLLWLVGLLLVLGCAYRWRLHRRRWWWRLNCDSDWAGTGAGTYTNLDDATTGTN